MGWTLAETGLGVRSHETGTGRRTEEEEEGTGTPERSVRVDDAHTNYYFFRPDRDFHPKQVLVLKSKTVKEDKDPTKRCPLFCLSTYHNNNKDDLFQSPHSPM